MKPPTIRSKDLRRFSILPIEAVRDPEINRSAALSVLAAICSYTDELGRTFVSQARLAKDLGISRQAVSRQVQKLLQLGYLVHARKQYKDQKTTTFKVKYGEQHMDEDEQRSNLSAKEQMDLAEREAGLTGATPEVAGAKGQVQHQKLQVGATSEVDRRATSEVAQNETLTSNNNDIKNKARLLCSLFLKAADAFGTPRIWNERDFDLAQSWVRDGLEPQQLADILKNHHDYCAKNARDFARGLGFFAKPVSRALGSSSNDQVNQVLRKTAAGLKRMP